MSSNRFFRNGELQGKTVIETSGNRLGKAKEIAFSLDGSSMLYVTKDDGTETEVASSRLIAIGEFIVVKSDAPQAPPMATFPAISQVPSAPVSPQTPAPAPIAPSPPPASFMSPAPAPVAMACRNCGSPLKPGAKFCTKCGTATF